jgi:hypothetical protein
MGRSTKGIRPGTGEGRVHPAATRDPSTGKGLESRAETTSAIEPGENNQCCALRSPEGLGPLRILDIGADIARVAGSAPRVFRTT